MELSKIIYEDMKSAMKAKEKLRLSVLRMLKSSVKNKEIDLGKPLEDADIMAVIRTMIKQREESVVMFKKGGRDELADKEAAEITTLSSYLPEPMSREDIVELVKNTVKELNASSMKDMGAVMKEAMLRSDGRADGKTLSALVKDALG